MSIFVRLLALVSLLLPGIGAIAADTPPDNASVYVVRHLNTPEGERDPDLLPEGRHAAAQLSERLHDAGIAAIYVTDFRRTRQTAGPLAERLGLTPIVYNPFDNAALVAQVRAGPLPALIVGHSNTVPEIVERLGGARPGPLGHHDFGDIWRIGPDGATTQSRIEGR